MRSFSPNTKEKWFYCIQGKEGGGGREGGRAEGMGGRLKENAERKEGGREGLEKRAIKMPALQRMSKI